MLRGEIVLMDHLPVHKVAGTAERSTAGDVNLPSEIFAGPQPDRADLKAHLRKAAAHECRIGRVVPISARMDAGTAMPAMFEHDRNPL
jgi:hypothetical protein